MRETVREAWSGGDRGERLARQPCLGAASDVSGDREEQVALIARLGARWRATAAPPCPIRLPGMPGLPSPPPALASCAKPTATCVAVDGLDLEIRPGECFGLLGPNGAGKTTTIEICEGLTAPDSGEVVILGRRWGDRRPRPPRAARHLAPGDPVLREAHGGGDGAPVPQLLPRGPVARRGHRPGAARREGRGPRRPALGRPAAAARARLRPGGRPRAALPRRADHRARPAVAAAALGPDRAVPGRRPVDSAHDPLHGGSRAAVRPGGDRGPWPGHRRRARRAS